MINKSITIEELLNLYPQSVSFLSEKGIRCIRCGEPLWGTIESAAHEKGFSDEQIIVLIDELTHFLNKKQ